MRKLTAMAAGVLTALAMQAEAPAGYYDSCEGRTGNALLKALCTKVGPHHNVGYDGLWEVYKTSDVRADGTLWDIYSTKAWPRNFTKCGNYKLVGDCVNKEHSFPKSWWGGGKQVQYSDAYHLYPTDGRVNGQRSNFPYGECAGGSSVASNGSVKALGRLGTSTFPGYSGKVFEPDDQYKGDLARTYFYMAAAYNDKIGGWSSDMLAGNSYPVFSTWAVNLLLKWSRQDPVSQKELDRNDAVSAHQNNRNPFIDHPELAEYIWGNKVGIAWYADAQAEPQINMPADGSTVDLGLSAVNVERRTQVTVKGAALEEDVRVSLGGSGFSVKPAVLSAAAVNGDGGILTVSYISSTAGASTGTLRLTSGDASCTVTLVAQAMDGLPLGEPYDITDESFAVDWTCLDEPSATYTLDVRLGAESVEGYPRQVRAGDETATVSGLQPETTYTVTLRSAGLTSATRTVTTAAPIPSVELLFDGELEFTAVAGEPSETAEILILTDNIPGEVTVSVAAPFQVSTDKATWSTSTVLQPGEERFYMRLLAPADGEYSTAVTVTAAGFHYDDVEASGTVSDAAGEFYEDFEPICKGDSYTMKTYEGSACTWTTNAIFNNTTDQGHPHGGAQAARFGKSGERYLTMLESKPDGIGTVSFWARLWGKESGDARFDVMISADGGQTWETAGTVTVPSLLNAAGSENEYAEFLLPVNRSGSLRLKLSQTAGGRALVDDLRMTGYRNVGGVEAANMAEYHSWDAFCRGGLLVLESADGGNDNASVYAMDGTERFSGLIGAGRELNVAPGLYVVTVRDFSRTVLVK